MRPHGSLIDAMPTVPVTPAVVDWAVAQSGYTLDEIGKATETDAGTVKAWMQGSKKPSLGQARKLAKKLRRPLAFLLWPSPPADAGPHIAFRAPIAEEMRELNSIERRYIRQAARLQDVLAFVRREIDETVAALPQFSLSSDPSAAARRMRDLLGVDIETQVNDWSSEYVAFREWRARFEALGIFVFTLALGDDSVRGINLAHNDAPIIIVNTAFHTRARIYTLFHELGHIVTRTTSACAASFAKVDSHSEHVERWCEQFAAAALMPWRAVESYLMYKGVAGKVSDVSTAGSISNTFKVSLQAAALRLINNDRATWSLWNAIPKTANDKRAGGRAPDEPRTTPVVRLHEVGVSATKVLLGGMHRDVLARSQVASYLRVDDNALSEIERRVSGSTNEAAGE